MKVIALAASLAALAVGAVAHAAPQPVEIDDKGVFPESEADAAAAEAEARGAAPA